MNDLEKSKSKAAAYLGSLGSGKPKTLSDDERERRRSRMAVLNKARAEAAEAKRKEALEAKELVAIRAQAGVFTPIQDSE